MTNNVTNKKRLRLVGLTGGIGSGKSTVAEFFRALNVTVKDADLITRDLVAPEQPALQLIVKHFGEEILLDDGSLNRSKLRNRIFQSEQERLWLENLLHPLVKKEILELKEKIPTGEYWIVAIPLLMETHFESAVDRVLVVDCPEAQQIARVMKRDGLARADIEAIIKTQTERENRLSKADDIIINDEAKSDLMPADLKLSNLGHSDLKLSELWLSDLKGKVLDLHKKYSLLANN